MTGMILQVVGGRGIFTSSVGVNQGCLVFLILGQVVVFAQDFSIFCFFSTSSNIWKTG